VAEAAVPVPSVARPASGPSGPVIDLVGPLARVKRHRRFVPLGACLLLVAVAAVTAMPPVSAAGGPAPTPNGSPVGDSPPSDSPVVGTSDSGTTTSDQAPAPASVAADPGDGTVYNVMQTVEIAPGSSDFQIYVVRGGDGLNKVAGRYGLKGATIYWANVKRLPNPASISIGLKLVIPPTDGITVTVAASSTLSGFASKYKVSVQSIMSANGMSDATLTAGQLLVIPVAQVPAIPTPKPAGGGGGGGGGGGTGWTGQRLLWPVPSTHTITQYFSSRHAAIDIGAPKGSPVVAAVRGTVIFAGWKLSGSAGYGGGLVVWISSGGKLYTTYNHLSAEFVHVGQVVAAGQRIGNVGATGNATGPHLHFEVWACYPWTGGTTACARNPMGYF
jgi:LysM repeat protein